MLSKGGGHLSKILCSALVAMGLFFVVQCVLAEAQNVQVQMVVPAPAPLCGNGVIDPGEACDDSNTNNGDGCSSVCQIEGGGGPNIDLPPAISNVTTSTEQTTAKVRWNATDDRGVRDQFFVYGLTNAYGSNGVFGLVAGAYETNINGLAVNTLYFFKITVTDTNNQTVSYAGTFTTKPPPPADNVPPVISNVVAASGVNSATVSWDTNEPADSQVQYGLTAQYGSSVSDVGLLGVHSLNLINLLPNTIYHFRVISTDAAGNSASSPDETFTTFKDNVPPPDVNNLELAINANSIRASWVNPGLQAVPDFAGVRVLRKVGGRSNNINDGLLIYSGNGQAVTDNNVLPNVEYFYTVFSADTSGNYSGGIFKSGKIVPGAVEICGNNIDDDGDGLADCLDQDCVASPLCRPPAEVCNNGVDDDLDGRTDCADLDCANAAGCGAGPVPPEVCDNNIDDDGDGVIDCPDPDCAALPVCRGIIVLPPGGGNVPDFAKLKAVDVIFLAGSRKIQLTPVNGVVISLSGTEFSVVVPSDKLMALPVQMTLTVDGADQHAFVLNNADNRYYSDITFPGAGRHTLTIDINYGADQLDSLNIPAEPAPWGQIYDESNAGLSGVAVTLSTGGVRFAAENYAEQNPLPTDNGGFYGWVVPNGVYDLVIAKDGYIERHVPALLISNNIVNRRQLIFAETPPLRPGESIGDIAANLLDRARKMGLLLGQDLTDIGRMANDLADNPTVEKTAREVAPIAVGVSAIGLAALTWLDLLALLRFLFLQPLLLLGRPRREKWGQVYNTLTKLPVDLATVRLISADTGKIIQSHVTDKNGRYIFFAAPGKYRLTVFKPNMGFPTKLLKDHKEDGRWLDIYHGEIIEVTEENTSIAANIPLDPAGADKTPARVVWGKRFRMIQMVISWAGLIITLISLYITPSWWLAALAVIHIALFVAFWRLAVPGKARGWGIVYDSDSRKPLNRTVARLYDAAYNKLVDTQITDGSGRYNFLVGESKYYVTYDHPHYETHKTDILDIKGEQKSAIALDVELKKATGELPPSKSA